MILIHRNTLNRYRISPTIVKFCDTFVPCVGSDLLHLSMVVTEEPRRNSDRESRLGPQGNLSIRWNGLQKLMSQINNKYRAVNFFKTLPKLWEIQEYFYQKRTSSSVIVKRKVWNWDWDFFPVSKNNYIPLYAVVVRLYCFIPLLRVSVIVDFDYLLGKLFHGECNCILKIVF